MGDTMIDVISNIEKKYYEEISKEIDNTLSIEENQTNFKHI